MAAAEPTPTATLARLRALRPDLTDALGQVADYVLAEPAAAARSTITELAERVGTSPGTITRFCRALDFAGYAGLRVALAEESGRAAGLKWETDIGREVQPGDSVAHVVKVVAGAAARALHETAGQLDLESVDRLVEALIGARRTDFFGVGNSAIAAAELQYRLHRIGVVCWSFGDVHNALTSAAQLGPGDLLVAISQSGRVQETLGVLATAKARGATTAAITGDPASALAKAADILLTSASYPGGQNTDATAARHSQMLLLDIVYARLAQLTHDRTLDALRTTAQAVEEHRLQ